MRDDWARAGARADRAWSAPGSSDVCAGNLARASAIKRAGYPPGADAAGASIGDDDRALRAEQPEQAS